MTVALILPFGPIVLALVYAFVLYSRNVRAGVILVVYSILLTIVTYSGMNFW